jgi:hypothetical protein
MTLDSAPENKSYIQGSIIIPFRDAILTIPKFVMGGA